MQSPGRNFQVVQPLQTIFCSALIMCRSEVHDTTNINGKRQKDPLGDHVTLCYKDEDQLCHGTYIASYGYVKDGSTLEFVQATHHAEKPDSTKKRNREDVWLLEESLIITPEIRYGHFLEEQQGQCGMY